LKLVIALDLESREEIFSWAEKFQGLAVVLKIGLRNLPQLGHGDLAKLKAQGFQIFIDAKLHDIPTQVAASVKTWADLGADYLTLHLSGGRPMLEAAVAAKNQAKHSVELFGVSVLTSMSTDDLRGIGVDRAADGQVEKLVRLGLHAGLRSFVCSAQEVARLRKAASEESKSIQFVCPGLALQGEEAASDQKRTATIEDAIKDHVDFLVVGRSILKDPNPRAKAEKILGLFAK
jgi:orotidine-5'-phosphate decarboxylase